MATFTFFLSSSPSPLPHLPSRVRPSPSLFSSFSPPLRFVTTPRNIRTPPLLASSNASSFDELSSRGNFSSADSSKKSGISNLIHEIEPLDVSLIQKDVPATTLDAMKRTISGMLGLLPSHQFHVSIEAFWEPLSKLLVSSMMTGYTLRNAEYRLCLERNLEIYEQNGDKQTPENCQLDLHGVSLGGANISNLSEKSDSSSKSDKISKNPSEDVDFQGLGIVSPKAQQYILHLRSHLSAVKKELREIQRKNAALQMQQFVGEEKNDLLDYLRSLQPEKVSELSEPSSPEVRETVHSVIHGLLATLSPKMHSRAPTQPENSSSETVNFGSEDCAELVENTSLHFQPLIFLTRDYLARLLFWCMLLGHYIRGLEYRMELMDLLSRTPDAETNMPGSDKAA